VVLVSSSANHYVTWSVTKFVAHHMSVDSIASVAFNMDLNTMSVAFTGKDAVSVAAVMLLCRCVVSKLEQCSLYSMARLLPKQENSMQQIVMHS